MFPDVSAARGRLTRRWAAMKHSQAVLLLVCSLTASCASAPRTDCGSLAPAADGWRSIAPPAEAAAITAVLPGKAPGPLRWYARGPEEYRVTSCIPCDGVAYAVERDGDTWDAEVDGLSYCHPVRPN
jgi:hypothetical protein